MTELLFLLGVLLLVAANGFFVAAEFSLVRARETRVDTAIINGFGFGGINAHLLIEEWTDREPSGRRVTSPGALLECPVAVVGLSSRSGSPIESLTVPVGRFRIPPRELEEILPQQVLMLQLAAEALDDTRSKPADDLSTGVYAGISLDPNTTNYHLRWLAAELDADRDPLRGQPVDPDAAADEPHQQLAVEVVRA